MKGITYVAHLKNVIKQIGSPRFDGYYVGDLTIKAQKEKDDDSEEKAVELCNGIDVVSAYISA